MQSGSLLFNMTSGYSSVRPGLEGSHNVDLPKGTYGVPDMMLYGFQNVRGQNMKSHPLEHSEQHWNENKLKMDFAMLRNLQGMHAPLKLQMELNTAKQMQRLPGLPSSRLMEDTLSGRNELIDFDDIFNVPEESESMVQPHVLMEKRQHIL